jgi:hypothetical protein
MPGASFLVREVPDKPISLDEVLTRWPVLRQSNLSRFDDCELSTLFGLRYENGWSTSPQARGTIEHRVFAECLRTMQRNDSESISPEDARAILIEKLRQHGVPPEDRVRVPWRELPDMEMAVTKWAFDNQFTIRNLLDVERRLVAKVPYRVAATGELIERHVSGQLDALIARGEDEVIVLDWKGTWALPPDRAEDNQKDGGGLSYYGFFQQRLYGLLVMENYASVNAVVLREFYHRRSKARGARITRQDLPIVREWLSTLVQAFDEAMQAGAPPRLTVQDLEAHGHWKPSPGKHCFNCTKAHLCPIDDDYKDGAIRTLADAERAAATRQKARSIAKRVTERCQSWVDAHGSIPVKNAKGRQMLGYRTIKGGRRFEEFTPESAVDRPSTEQAYDPNSDLARAMDASVKEARAQRSGKGRVA